MVGDRPEVLQAGHGRGDVDLGENVARESSSGPTADQSQLAKVMAGERLADLVPDFPGDNFERFCGFADFHCDGF